MTRLFTALAAIAAVGFAAINGAPVANSQSGPGWIQLFDGKTMDGWTPSNDNVNWRVEDGALVAGREGGVELGGLAHESVQLVEPPDLVALQRDERGHDENRSDDQLPGDLVDRGLPGARGQHRERVAPGDDRLHRLLLARPELLEAEQLAGGLADAAGADGGRRPCGVLLLARHRHPLPDARDRQTERRWHGDQRSRGNAEVRSAVTWRASGGVPAETFPRERRAPQRRCEWRDPTSAESAAARPAQ